MPKFILLALVLVFATEKDSHAQIYRTEGEGVRTKRWMGEIVTRNVRVGRHTQREFEFDLAVDEYEYRAKMIQEETGYFKPGCDWTFRYAYDPRWDIYTRIPRDHYYDRAWYLSEIIGGVDYHMALNMVQDGRFRSRPTSYHSFRDEFDGYHLRQWVFSDRYYHDNLVALGAIRPGFEVECGGTFVHIVYDRVITAKTRTGNTLRERIHFRVEDGNFWGREEDRFTVYFDGVRSWVRADRNNRHRYRIEQDGGPHRWLATAVDNHVQRSNTWDQVDTDFFSDFESDDLVIEFKDHMEDGRHRYETVMYISLYQEGRWRDSRIFTDYAINLQRDDSVFKDEDLYIIGLNELARRNGRRLRSGRSYAVKISYKRKRTDVFDDNLTREKRLPKRGYINY